MELINIYECFCDRTRLRILNLLTQGPLCVCHLQEILGESQVKISKHLSYLKTHGMVVARREANWMIYTLPEKQMKELSLNLACLQDCAEEDRGFRGDQERLRKLHSKLQEGSPLCCSPRRTKKMPSAPQQTASARFR